MVRLVLLSCLVVFSLLLALASSSHPPPRRRWMPYRAPIRPPFCLPALIHLLGHSAPPFSTRGYVKATVPKERLIPQCFSRLRRRPSPSLPRFTTMSATVKDTASGRLANYVDVHCHLTHEQFTGEEDAVAIRAHENGLEYCIVNGLEPESNRAVMDLCLRHSHSLLPALGIYPIDAACNVIRPEAWHHPFPPPTPFNIEEEVAFIDKMCDEGKIVAIGECGLDAHYLTDKESLAEQERVLRSLIQVAKKHDLPVILHTRKAEQRTFEILQEMEVTKADFHCYGGKIKLAKQIAAAGYYLSLPSAVARIDSFQKLAKELPMDKILTETDSPYMGPQKDMRNEPATVPQGVKAIAKVKGMTEEEVANAIRDNFRRLFAR